MRIGSQPTYFDSANATLFGMMTFPEDKRIRGAVLICPALGKEANHTTRALKRVSEKLAERGLLSLRFDYAGTGESSGQQDAPNAVELWDESITAAATLLSSVTSAPLVTLGYRMGGLLAAENAAVKTKAAALVLWDPVTSARRFVRSQKALYSVITERDHAACPDLDDPDIRLAGLFLHPTAAEHLFKKRLTSADLRKRPGTPLLALLRAEDMASESTNGSLGADTDVVAIGDQARLLNAQNPWYSSYPTEIGTVVSWIDDHVGNDLDDVNFEARTSASMGVTHDGRDIVTEVRVRDDGIVVWDTAADGTHETADRILVSHPIGHDIRSGPARLYAELALDVAACGGRMVRFDRPGVGESGATCESDTFSPLFTSDYSDSAMPILDELGLDGSPADAPEIVAHVGICAGSWMSSQAAIETARRAPGTHASAVLVNPNRWGLRPGSAFAPVDPDQPVSDAGKFDAMRRRWADKAADSLSPRVGKLMPKWLSAWLGSYPALRMPDALVDGIRRRGVDVRFVFGPNDGAAFHRLNGPAAIRRRGWTVQVRESAVGDHSGYHINIHRSVKSMCLDALGFAAPETAALNDQVAATEAALEGRS